MALFDFSGFDSEGKNTRGSIEATSKRVALDMLREQGVYVSSLAEQSSGQIKARSCFPWHRNKLSITDLATATRLLATLLQAGVPLDEALQSLVEQVATKEQARVFSHIREDVRQGSPFFQSIRQQGVVFPDLYIRIVEVGESSGSLDKVLLRLADYLEEQALLQARITSALAYPLLMVLVGGAVLMFLVTFVLPKITRMLLDMGQSLPLPTRLLIGTGKFMATYGWGIALLLIIAVVLLRRFRSTESGRFKSDVLLLKMPLIGFLQTQIATARFSRTLATLLHSGVPLLNALEITKGLLNNHVMQKNVSSAINTVREGGELASVLRNGKVFSPILAQMTAIGERSGNLEDMLLKVADNQDKQVEIAISGMLSLLEPLMILAMGGVIGFIVLAVLLPIFQASQGLG